LWSFLGLGRDHREQTCLWEIAPKRNPIIFFLCNKYIILTEEKS
jgi:hypothetical protein